MVFTSQSLKHHSKKLDNWEGEVRQYGKRQTQWFCEASYLEPEIGGMRGGAAENSALIFLLIEH